MACVGAPIHPTTVTLLSSLSAGCEHLPFLLRVRCRVFPSLPPVTSPGAACALLCIQRGLSHGARAGQECLTRRGTMPPVGRGEQAGCSGVTCVAGPRSTPPRGS